MPAVVCADDELHGEGGPLLERVEHRAVGKVPMPMARMIKDTRQVASVWALPYMVLTRFTAKEREKERKRERERERAIQTHQTVGRE